MDKNVNEGHRARMRQRMMKEGLDSFQDHEILEFLLFQYIPRKDTNKLAHTLLDQFGGFSGVLDADPDQLMMVPGISEVTACNLALLKEIWKRYNDSNQKRTSLRGIGDIIKYAEALTSACYNEELIVVYVDNATRYMKQDIFQSQSTQYVSLDMQRIIRTAMQLGSVGVILFHCHVKGVCVPSDADMRFTERLAFALANIGVALIEHIIFNGTEDYYSFYTHGDMDRIHAKYKSLKD